jgi:hypothetical protein
MQREVEGEGDVEGRKEGRKEESLWMGIGIGAKESFLSELLPKSQTYLPLFFIPQNIYYSY